jgi:hypothetical protein
MAEDAASAKFTERAMEATAQFEEDLAERAPSITRQEALREDAYWQRNFWQERYYDPSFEYEDYAPAFCVGYVGCAQYGGEFADAQRCLGANWERIRGDSRLHLDEALPAMRAAWQRMVRARRQPRLTVIEGGRARPTPHRSGVQPGRLAVVGAAAAAAPQ